MRSLVTVARQVGLLWLSCLPLAASAQTSDQTEGGFWDQHLYVILVAVISFVLGRILADRINSLLGFVGGGVRKLLYAFGWRFRKRYLAALSEKHQWLRLIGIFNRAHLNPPRLREVYVSLRLAAGEAATSPSFSWNQVFSPEQGSEQRCCGGPCRPTRVCCASAAPR